MINLYCGNQKTNSTSLPRCYKEKQNLLFVAICKGQSYDLIFKGVACHMVLLLFLLYKKNCIGTWKCSMRRILYSEIQYQNFLSFTIWAKFI